MSFARTPIRRRYFRATSRSESTRDVWYYEHPLPVPGRVTVVEAGLVLETSVVRGTATPGESSSQQLLDMKLAETALSVRNWLPGERFWPAHTKQLKKLKDLLQDRHISGEQKKRWAVVASGDEIVWVRRLGVRHDLLAKNNDGILIRECPDPGNPE